MSFSHHPLILRAPRGGTHPGRNGFSLIELLAVIVILGILMTYLTFRLMGMGRSAEISTTRTNLQMISGAVSGYEGERGDYPPSAWKAEWGALPNKTNLGAETLCLCLWSKDYGGTGISEDNLTNSDEDQSIKNLTTHALNDLFELQDSWGNPIAYLHRRDYDREDLYWTTDPETGEQLDSRVRAMTNPATGNPYNPRTFQLLSAGPDGVFGTEDDIGNFTPANEGD